MSTPSHYAPPKAAVLREETVSSRLSLEAKIDQFELEGDMKEQGEPMIQLSDSKDELDRCSRVRSPEFVVARITNNLEEEEGEDMPLER